MILNFKRFNESINKNVPFYLSKGLRQILGVIRDEGNVYAKAILENHSNDIGSDITFINVTKQNDILSFISDDRVMRLFKTSKQKDFDDWFDKVSDDETSDVWVQMRNPIKVGKFLTKFANILSLKLDDTSHENFINSFKSTHDIINDNFADIDIVKGESMRKWFLGANFESNRGQLGKSCMRYEGCQPYFDIYCKNPEVCSMLILWSKKDENKIRGRVLLWKTNKGIFMDRIYTNNDSDIVLLNRYRDVNKMMEYPEGQYVQLSECEFDMYPYLDNFKWLDVDSCRLYYGVQDETDKRKLQNTDGTFTENAVWSEWEGEYIDEDEAVYCEHYGHILRENAVYLEYDGHWYPATSNEACFSNYFEEYYHKSECVYSEFLESDIPRSESIEYYTSPNSKPDFIANELISLLIQVEYDGNEYRSMIEHLIFDPIENRYRFKDETVQLSDHSVLIGEFLSQKVDPISKSGLIDNIRSSKVSVDIDKLLKNMLNINTGEDFSIILRYFLRDSKLGERIIQNSEFYEVLKFFLILHIIMGKKVISDIMYNRAIYSYKRFNQLIIDDRMDPYLNMVSKDVLDILYDKHDWRVKLAFKCYKLALLVRNHIIDDPISKFTFDEKYN